MFPRTLVQTIHAKIHLQNKLSNQLKRFRQHLLKSIPKNGQPRRKVTDRLAYVWITNQNCVFILVGTIIAYQFKNPPDSKSEGFFSINNDINEFLVPQSLSRFPYHRSALIFFVSKSDFVILRVIDL